MSVWLTIEQIDTLTLVDYLKHEYPQTVAVILYHINRQKAADIIEHLPENFSVECLVRCWRLIPLPNSRLKMIEEILESWIETTGLNTTIARSNNNEVLKEIIMACDEYNRNRICTALGERNRDLKENLT